MPYLPSLHQKADDIIVEDISDFLKNNNNK